MAAATTIASEVFDEAWVYAQLDKLVPKLMAEHAFEHGARTEAEVVLTLRRFEVSPNEIATRLPAVMAGIGKLRSYS